MRKTILRSIFVSLICIAAAPSIQAQSYYMEPHGFSLGTSLGISDLWGDVGTKSPIEHYMNSEYKSNIKGMGGFFFRYTFSPGVALRMSMNYGTLYANDNWNYNLAKSATTVDDDAYQRYARNQDIKVNMWEGSMIFELTPRRFNPESKAAQHRGQPYVMGGIGAFHFRPKSTYVNRATGVSTLVDIYDLNLEAQGVKDVGGAPPKYSLWQLEVPLGLGYRWDIGNHLSLGVEYLWRMTMTDYLDGVSDKYVDPNIFTLALTPDKAAIAKDMYDKSWLVGQPAHAAGEKRGNKSNNDSYSTFSITFAYKIKSLRHPWWGVGYQ